MVQYQPHFDTSFAAISDATRRGVLEQLGRADSSITELAERFDMTLTGMKKHVSVLEQAGFVTTRKVGRVRTCSLGGRGLEEEAAWIERYRQMWAARFAELDKVIEQLSRRKNPMDAIRASEKASAPVTTTDRSSEREVVITRTFDAPARIVFQAWTTPELLMKWWTPASFGITFISCEADVRKGGTYRFVMGHPAFEKPMAFVGRYLEVDPPRRLVWTNEENENGSVTTVTFEERDGKTHLVLRDLHPSKEALDEELASGAISGYPEQFNQLDILLKSLN